MLKISLRVIIYGIRLMFIYFAGRFGNQADNFLGALAFAKGVNRSLVLPPWVEYRYGEPKSVSLLLHYPFLPKWGQCFFYQQSL